MNVNCDHDKAVVVETPMMGLLVSGLFWLKVKQRKTKSFSKLLRVLLSSEHVLFFALTCIFCASSLFEAAVISNFH